MRGLSRLACILSLILLSASCAQPTGPGIQIPGAVLNFLASDGAPDSILLQWQDPTTGGAPEGFEIQVRDDVLDPWSAFADHPAEPSGSYSRYDSPLGEDVNRYYRIRAYNTAGEGPWSEDSGSTSSGGGGLLEAPEFEFQNGSPISGSAVDVPAGTVIRIVDSNNRGLIHYTTDGNDPDPASPSGDEPEVTVSTGLTLKARTIDPGTAEESAVSSLVVTITATPKAPDPLIQFDQGSGYQDAAPSPGNNDQKYGSSGKILLSDGISGSYTIRYTLDGSDPALGGATVVTDAGVGPFTLDDAFCGGDGQGTIRALVRASGYEDSDEVRVDYRLYVDAVSYSLSPAGSPVSGRTRLTLTSDTPDAAIEYKLAGDSSWLDYSAGNKPWLYPSPEVFIQARATKAGYLDWDTGAPEHTEYLNSSAISVAGLAYRTDSNEVYMYDAGAADPEISGFDETPVTFTFYKGALLYADASGVVRRLVEGTGDDLAIAGFDQPALVLTNLLGSSAMSSDLFYIWLDTAPDPDKRTLSRLESGADLDIGAFTSSLFNAAYIWNRWVGFPVTGGFETVGSAPETTDLENAADVDLVLDAAYLHYPARTVYVSGDVTSATVSDYGIFQVEPENYPTGDDDTILPGLDNSGAIRELEGY